MTIIRHYAERGVTTRGHYAERGVTTIRRYAERGGTTIRHYAKTSVMLHVSVRFAGKRERASLRPRINIQKAQKYLATSNTC